MLGQSWGTKLSKRLFASTAVLPTAVDVKHLAAAAVLATAVLASSVRAGVFKWQPIQSPRALGWAAAYMLFRASAEEVVFRALMLPHPKVDGAAALSPWKFTLSAILPVLLFAISHAATTQRLGGTVLGDSKFLVTVTLVGVMCSWAYWVTAGGLWAAITMHFLTVFPWMVLLGGHKKTHTPTPLKTTPARDLAPGGATDTKNE